MADEVVDEAATEESTLALTPSEDVYSFFMYALPVEEKKFPGKFTWTKCLAYLLVISVLVIQTVFQYAIFKVIVIGDLEWQNSIVKMEIFEPGHCNPGGSLCYKNKTSSGDDIFSCAPPTVQVTAHWDELDTNGDGIWTKEEVLAKRDELKCKYVVDPYEVFQVFIKFLILREKVIWLHPDIYAFKAIHRFYFTYAMGDVVMCGYRNQNMCPNLLQRGIFDGPLAHGTAPRVGTTIDSALNYCYTLLEDGGLCERFLPSTYRVWKKKSTSQCQGAGFSSFVYKHPTDGTFKTMLKVGYGAPELFDRAAGSQTFVIYKICIIVIYLMAMFVEMKKIVDVTSWLVSFPSAGALDNAVEAKGKGDELRYIIKGVSGRHRLAVGFVTLLRFILLMAAIQVGVTFLLSLNSYLDLILNGLGLIFIIDVLKLFYEQVLDPEVVGVIESTEPMEFNTCACCAGRPARREVLWSFAMMALCGVWCYWHAVAIVHPMKKALQCTCLSEGDSCHEAHRFSNEWWREYWVERVPDVFAQVDALRSGIKDSAPSPVNLPTVAVAPAPRPILLTDAVTVPHNATHNTADALVATGRHISEGLGKRHRGFLSFLQRD